MENGIALSDLQAAFVREFVDRGDGDYAAAARAAGYAENTAKTAKYWATRSPEILAAVHLETARRTQEGGTIGFRVLRELALHSESEKIQLDAAKSLVSIAGHVAPKAKSQDNAGRELHEMSLDELKSQRDRLEGEIVGRAKVLNAPSVPDSTTQEPDLLG